MFAKTFPPGNPAEKMTGVCSTCKTKIDTVRGQAKTRANFAQVGNASAECPCCECPKCKATVWLVPTPAVKIYNPETEE